MKTSIWYSVKEKQPSKTGYYLAFKGLTIGDDEIGTEYYYWDSNRREWRDSMISNAHYANVIFWTDADPAYWYEDDRAWHTDEITPAEKDAWAAVQLAIDKYEMVKALATKKPSR